jgi:hypothetical protein
MWQQAKKSLYISKYSAPLKGDSYPGSGMDSIQEEFRHTIKNEACGRNFDGALSWSKQRSAIRWKNEIL